MFQKWICIGVLLGTLGFGVENSLIHELDAGKYLEQHRNKFPDRQYEELLAALEAPCKLRIMSYNILSQFYDQFELKENQWESRKARVLELIFHDNPDIICCQELTPNQIDDLMPTLGQEYEIYAPMPDQGGSTSDSLGILYRKNRFLLKQGEKKELGNMYYREQFGDYRLQYFIKGVFLDKDSGKEFVVYNTHADYLKPNVRLKLVDFLLGDAEKETKPTIVAGDFNTLPNMIPDPYHDALTPGVDGSYVLQTLTKGQFRNSSDLTLIGHVGPLSSFTYHVESNKKFAGLDSGLLLDHIFVTPETIKVIFHAIEPATVEGHFPSDHVPVIVDLSIS